MESIEKFFSKPKNVIISAATLGVVLLIGIGIVLAILLGGSDRQSNRSTNTDKNSGSDFSSGNVSGLSGSTSSYRNLKGLTVRINQIETCNPKAISAYVAVSTEAGVVNKNFDKKDVELYLDGKKMTNFEFDPVSEKKTPLTNVLVIDHSGSMQGAPMDNAKSAAASYVSKLGAADQVGVIQFDNQIDVLQAPTTDKVAAANVISTIQPRGDTSIYDAVVKGVETVPDCGRKALTVLTDGEDTTSVNATESSAIDRANEANLPVFSVGIKGPRFVPNSIQKISESTGAQYLEANTPQDISSIYDKINGQLTGQFVANLKLSIPKDGKKHTLKIVSNVEGSPTSSERTFVY
jgi:VWFA-related protein